MINSSDFDLAVAHDLAHTPKSQHGTKGDEELKGGDGNDKLLGLGGDDTLYGGDGNDTLVGGPGNNSVSGGAGDDRLYLGTGNDSIDGGDGTDVLFLTAGKGWTFGETVALNTVRDQNNGHGGIFQVANIEHVSGSALGDNISGSAVDDTLAGAAGNDRIDGDDGNDVLYGDGAFNAKGKIVAEVGTPDPVRSYDLIDGGTGDDTIFGGYGADSLTGGDGRDTFVFMDGDSKPGMSAWITDLDNHDDRIDLHLIDADTTRKGDQAFHLVDHFTGHAGEATIVASEEEASYLELDTDGDGQANISIGLGAGDHSGFSNFVL